MGKFEEFFCCLGVFCSNADVTFLNLVKALPFGEMILRSVLTAATHLAELF